MSTLPKRRGRPRIQEITPSQQRTLDTFCQMLEERGFPPTVKELAERMGMAGPSAHDQINQLIRKGYLKRQDRKARSLTVARAPETLLASLDAVPIVGQVAAGPPILAEENVIGHVQVDSRLVRGKMCFALKVQGNSMTNAGIRSGDLVIVREQPMAENGDIVVALLDGEATVKRLSIQDGVVQLCPENKRYKPIPITRESPCEIVGKVVAHCRGH